VHISCSQPKTHQPPEHWRNSQERYLCGYSTVKQQKAEENIGTKDGGRTGNLKSIVLRGFTHCAFHQTQRLAEHNTIQLVWVPGHTGIDRNEMADETARQGSSHSLIGTETPLRISVKFAR